MGVTGTFRADYSRTSRIADRKLADCHVKLRGFDKDRVQDLLLDEKLVKSATAMPIMQRLKETCQTVPVEDLIRWML